MKIMFKVEKEDLINFSLFSNKKRQKESKINKIMILVIIAFLLISYIPEITREGFSVETGIAIFITLLIVFVIFFVTNPIFNKLNQYLIKKGINKWNFSANFWEFYLEIHDNSFKISWNEVETIFPVDKIINIIENEKYFYLYLTTCSAYAINKESVSWDKEEMFQFFREKSKELTNKKTTS